MRALIHKTKGKLDLRSLTVFGLNAKPETDTPIGYFGTGLKYAVAVLARNNIPVIFWIDGKRWRVVKRQTNFRQKGFEGLELLRETLIPKTVVLPFTTELGKNWELWQAYRELESNTRDEKGETFILGQADILDLKGHTIIEVKSEEYINVHLDRYSIFLPDGMVQREGTETMQVFARKSDYIYYRGIRIVDLKEPTQNTYNFLKQIELTEDRTAKHPFSLELDIERFIGQETKDPELVRRAVTAPPKTYERGLSYDYTFRSELFLNTVTNVGDDATEYSKSVLRRDRPPEEPKETYCNWVRDLIASIDRSDYDRVKVVIDAHTSELIQCLGSYAATLEKEETNNVRGQEMVGRDPPETGGTNPSIKSSSDPEEGYAQAFKQEDDISF